MLNYRKRIVEIQIAQMREDRVADQTSSAVTTATFLSKFKKQIMKNYDEALLSMYCHDGHAEGTVQFPKTRF